MKRKHPKCKVRYCRHRVFAESLCYYHYTTETSHKDAEKRILQRIKLHDISKAYDKNFEKLMRAVGTPLHKKYVKEEQRLNRLSIKARNVHGLLIHDPCPVGSMSVKPCYRCSGWYEVVRKNPKHKYPYQKMKCAKEGVGTKCPYKLGTKGI